VAFRADTHSLVPLYAVGVVTSFTLAQAGMTRRHLRVREPGWRGGILINGVGALVALVVIVVGKFTEGAWMVVIAIPCCSGCCCASSRLTAERSPSSRSRSASVWLPPSPATRSWC
jgi:peptidoglycan/LPS O-acetylase OafA/YrhL